MSRALLLKRRPFAFPGGKPGFDPNHIASQGIVAKHGISVVASGGSYVNLLTGKPGTLVGTISRSIDGIVGPSVTTTSSSGAVNFSGNALIQDTSATYAAIFRPTAATLSNSFSVFMVNGSGTSGSVFFLASGVPTIQMLNGSSPDMAGKALTANVPYFILASVNASQAVFVTVNLNNGEINSFVNAGSTASQTTDGTYQIGNFVAASQNLAGPMSCLMFAPTFMSLTGALQWAQDPWSFWYPRKLDLTMMLSAGTSSSGSVASSLGSGTALGVGTSTAESTATATGTGTASAVGAALNASVASSTGVGTATGVTAVTLSSAASASGTGTATGIALSTAASVASSSGSGSATGVALSTAASVFTSSGTGTATGVGTSTGGGSAATSVGSGTASGVGISTAASVASSTGAGIATGVATSIAAATATSSGSGIASAVGLGSTASVGSSGGSGTAAGIATSIAAAVANANGSGVATGFVGGVASTGNASGAGTASGVSAVTLSAVGTASGVSTAQAFTDNLSIFGGRQNWRWRGVGQREYKPQPNHSEQVKKAAAVLSKMGGHARAASLTAKQRTNIASNAAKVRWK